jgi:hypothetical protein
VKRLVGVLLFVLLSVSTFAQQQFVKSVDTIAALKAANIRDTHKTIQVLGSAAKGDGGGALYYWDSASAAAGDDDSVVVSNMSATGRWLKIADANPSTAVSDGDKGDIVVTGSGNTWNLDANSVALGTDTTGNFVATISGTTGQIDVTGSGSENATIVLVFPAVIDLSTNTSVRIPNNNSPSHSGAGAMVYDSNAIDVDTGAIIVYDQNAGYRAVVATDASDTPTSGQVPKYNGTTIVWEDDENDAVGADNITVNGATVTDLNLIQGSDIDFDLDTSATPDEVFAFIRSNAVDYNQIQQVSAASRLLGRGDSGVGNVQEISLGAGLSMSGTTLGLSVSDTRVGVIRRIWVDAKDMLPVGSATNVNYIPSTTTDGMNATVIAFDGGSTERAQFRRKLDHWDGNSTNVTVQLVIAATSTGNSIWTVEAGSISAGGTFGNILGSASSNTTKTGTAANVMAEVKIDSFEIGNTPAATDLLYFRISRLGGDGSDTSTQDEYLLGAWVEYPETTVEQGSL